MKDQVKYIINKGYIMLPLTLDTKNLHAKITLFGDEYCLRGEFHVSLVCIKEIRRQHNISEEDLISFFNEFSSKYDLSKITYSNEFRIMSHEDGRKSLIQMVYIENIKLLFTEMNNLFNKQISFPPWHITIYTLCGKSGIGIHSHDDLKKSYKISFR